MLPQPINLSNQSEPQPQPQAPVEEILNGHGIHNSPQLILVSLLIIASVAVVFTTNQEIHQHDRYLRTYFNLNLLGKDDLGLYEEGLNIDECEMEFATLAEIQQHFTKMVNVSLSLKEDGLVVFSSNQEPVLRFEMQNRRNEFNSTAFYSVEEAFNYFSHFQANALKDWLLESYVFKLTVNFGDNKFVKNYTLTGEYKLYSLLMVRARLDTDYELRESKSRKLNGLRLTEQAIASLLFVIYVYQTILLRHQSKSHRLFSSEIQYSAAIQSKYRNWYLFLQLMCIVILFSPKYAPICAFLQILPVFEFPERQKENEMYNFNKNLRFSFPLIMSIFLQMFIFLNGFIFYSMLMYPGEYFDDYLKGFFSYVYQLFQVGTFEIFTELEDYGNFAYMLYALLYFYVFELGNALVPALFVILIEMKITGEVLKRHVTELAHEAVCPQCNEKNSQAIDSNNVNIVVSSPRISPLINRKKFNRADEDESEGLMLYIEEEDIASPKHEHQRFHQNVKFANYSKRILNIARKLNIQVFKHAQKAYLEDCLKKIQALSQPQ